MPSEKVRAMAKIWKIDDDYDCVRLDRFLRKKYSEVPLGAIMRAIRKGRVTVNGEKTDPSYRLHRGDEVSVPFEDPAKLKPSLNVVDKPLEVIFMDENVLIINKPAGLLSQPAFKEDDSVVNRALNLINKTKGGFIPTPAHRLDRNISGVMALALNPRSLRALTSMFRNRRVAKKYLAVVRGRLTGEGVIEAPLERDEHLLKTVVSKGEGKRSVTRYMSLSAGNHASLVALEPITGRPHQLRVHLSHIGHPIVGDVKYGDSGKEARRPMLHAYSLEIFGNDLSYLAGKKFCAPLPADLAGVINLFDLSLDTIIGML